MRADLEAVKDLAVPQEDVAVVADERLGRERVAAHVQHRGVEAQLDFGAALELHTLEDRVAGVGTCADGQTAVLVTRGGKEK